jgi:lysylphosphatidylglycerol synthetase-like protein (DUF2156 family)
MPIIFVVILFLIVALFSLSSVSQSYATAKQAQAAIEASRVAQIASTGNLVSLVTVALVIVAVLTAVVVTAWLVLRARAQPKRHWTRTNNGGWDQFDLLSKSQHRTNALVEALMTQLLYEMSQHQQHQDNEQFLMNEPAMLNDTFNDTPSFPDNTWDM